MSEPQGQAERVCTPRVGGPPRPTRLVARGGEVGGVVGVGGGVLVDEELGNRQVGAVTGGCNAGSPRLGRGPEASAEGMGASTRCRGGLWGAHASAKPSDGPRRDRLGQILGEATQHFSPRRRVRCGCSSHGNCTSTPCASSPSISMPLTLKE